MLVVQNRLKNGGVVGIWVCYYVGAVFNRTIYLAVAPKAVPRLIVTILLDESSDSQAVPIPD